MKTENLVNGYVLPNLFYELMFLDEHGIDGNNEDWMNNEFVEGVIRSVVLSRFESFNSDTMVVVRNTLRYLLVAEDEDSELWDVIWQASSAPIPTPHGVRYFFTQCHDVLFAGEVLPLRDELSNYHVNHESQIANRLN